ncbi:MAG: dTMP kinase [Chloroflexota bacterium]|nr:MAG: dTMP kinase [Chloroflexota bacterium]
MLITFEGMDGSGKSTQARLFAEYLRASLGAEKIILTREPGGTPIGEQIREVLHSMRNQEMAARTEFLLYNAARAQVVAQVIRPALEQAKIVLSDRFGDSTLVYQGYGRQLDLEMVKRVIEYATGGLKPDLTFFLDVAIEEGLARRSNGHQRGEELNRMDTQTREFYERVRNGYETLMRQEPTRWIRVDGARSIEQVQFDLREKFNSRQFIPTQTV